ncbi:MAG TPA: hypothetical protein EYQ80_04615 [Candidatus Poseidoniales archaeon]|nr:hypothetical protein [Candidatus Poseidoniales archaeon]
MFGRLMTLSMFAGGFVAGVAQSSFRHYYRRYADEEDLRQAGEIVEVVIVQDETKKSRRSKS